MSKSWWEIKILCDPKLEDSVYWRLEKLGFSGTATESEGELLLLRAYLPQNQAEPLDLAALAHWLSQDALLMGLAIPITAWELIAEQDWDHVWKKHWQPREIGDRLLIYPAWLEPPTESERMILRLDPGAAFGTGEHPTTQLCLEALEMRFYIPQDDLVIADIGCGSGILSIGACLLGAKQVYAVDIDPLAISSATHNRELNQISPTQLSIKQGSVEQLAELAETGVDGIVCNILADVIIDLIPQMTKIAKPTTWAVLSGIILDQIEPVVDKLEEYNWNLATIWKREQWCCINMRR